MDSGPVSARSLRGNFLPSGAPATPGTLRRMEGDEMAHRRFDQRGVAWALLLPRMLESVTFRHAGGGRKGLFIVLRYVFIVAASYLLIFQDPGQAVSAGPATMIAIALASNVALSLLPAQYVFAWYIEAPVMIADTLWVSWALHQTGASSQEL